MSVELPTTTTAAAAEIAFAAAAAAAAATTEIAAGTFFTRTRFVHGESPTIEFFAIEIRDGLVGLFLRSHLHEREATGLAREFVHDEFATDDIARLLEQVKNLPLGRVKREVAYE